jgi:hypothetical protein
MVSWPPGWMPWISTGFKHGARGIDRRGVAGRARADDDNLGMNRSGHDATFGDFVAWVISEKAGNARKGIAGALKVHDRM